MYKTIIIPVDVEHPEKAKDMVSAAKQAGSKDAHVVFVNVVEDVPLYVAAELPGGIIEKSKEKAREQLEEIAEGTLAKGTGSNSEVVVRSGQAGTAIIATAEEKGADLIIIASHKPGLQDYLLGSTAGRVVRHAKCSVLVLR